MKRAALERDRTVREWREHNALVHKGKKTGCPCDAQPGRFRKVRAIGCSCAMCKPHKRGWVSKYTLGTRGFGNIRKEICAKHDFSTDIDIHPYVERDVFEHLFAGLYELWPSDDGEVRYWLRRVEHDREFRENARSVGRLDVDFALALLEDRGMEAAVRWALVTVMTLDEEEKDEIPF